MALAWNLGFGEPFQKSYGVSITKSLQYFNGHSTDYYVDSEEYERFNRRLEELISDEEFLINGCGGISGVGAEMGRGELKKV